MRDINAIIFEGIANGKMYNLSEAFNQVKRLFKQSWQGKIDVKATKLKSLAHKLIDIQSGMYLPAWYFRDTT